MTTNWKRVAIALGFAVSAVALYYSLEGLDWTRVVAALRNARTEWLVVGAGFVLVGIFCRAERWHALSGVPLGRVRFYRAEALAFLANYLYPGRAGDALRIGMVTATGACPVWRATLAAVVDRVLDLGVLLVLAAALWALIPDVPLRAEIIATGAMLFGFALIVLIVKPVRDRIANLAARSIELVVGRLLGMVGQGERVRSALSEFRSDLTSSPFLGRLASIEVAVIVMDYLACAALLHAFGWLDHWTMPVILWVFLSAGAAIPAAPAALGIYQVACVLALGLRGIPAEDAIAFSFLSQITNLIAIVASCAVSLVLIWLPQQRAAFRNNSVRRS